MDFDRLDSMFDYRSILVVYLRILQFLEHVEPINHFSKDRVLSVQGRLLVIRDKELGPVAVRSTACHRENSTSTVLNTEKEGKTKAVKA